MARLDTQARELRTQALQQPITRATQNVTPRLDLGGGAMIAISANK